MSTAGVWKEAQNADGRTYYWHTVTKETRWDKPAVEDDAAPGAWKEIVSPEGRTYYHNTVTKATTWDKPLGFKSNEAPTEYVAGGSQMNQTQQNQPKQQFPRRNYGQDFVAAYPHHGEDFDRNNSEMRHRLGPNSQLPKEVDYGTFEEAEETFKTLLKRTKIKSDANWKDTLPLIIKEPEFRALKDPKERKAAFDAYLQETKAENIQQERARLAKLKQDFGLMLDAHPEIEHFTRWKSALPFIEGETIFKAANNETERRKFFRQHQAKIRRQHEQDKRAAKTRERAEFRDVLPSLGLAPYTTWSKAEEILAENDLYPNNDKFKNLHKIDVFVAFEEHVMQLERSFNASRQDTMRHKRRRERQNRDKLTSLLEELRAQGKVNAGTQWKQIHELVKDDERYTAMLGQPGSSPLDLFRDAVEEEDRILRSRRNKVLDALDDEQYEITSKTTFDDFMQVMQRSGISKTFERHDLQLIFDRLLGKVTRHEERHKHTMERAERKAVDALRSRIKRLDPPVHVSDSWEDVRPRIAKLEEYRVVRDEDSRRSAFEKFIERVREKETQADAERPRRGEARDSRSNGHRRPRDSRSPEYDVYEADRREAIAARERQYRRSGRSPLSRSNWDVDKRDDGHRYTARLAHSRYDGERARDGQGRDHDRERGPYLGRGDPRDTAPKALDYGDSGRAGSMNGSVGRRRRGTDATDDERDYKRSRREDSIKAKAEEAKVEEEALKSGSEEGEIEEI